jgi:hypothetical protein
VISFRQHVLTLVVIFMALAAGVALGGGPLSDLGRPAQAATTDPRPTEPEPADYSFPDAFAGSVGSALYGGRLHGHPVVILALPGADDDVVGALTGQVQAAGTQVIGTYALRRTLVDPGEKTLVDTLGLQLVTQLGPGVVTDGATTYDRIGQLIGRAVATTKPSATMEAAKVSSLRASLKGAGLLGVPDGEPGNAPLVLVVGGNDLEPVVLTGLVDGLAAVARGVVVAAPTADVGIAALRSAPPTRPVATVDGTERSAGQVAAVLALVHVLATPGGSFGASGSDSPVPLG